MSWKVRPFHQKSTCLTQSALGPCVPQIWSRYTLEFRGKENFVVRHVVAHWECRTHSLLARMARGQTHRLTSGVTSPLQGAEVRHPLFSPLKRGRDPGNQKICLPPGYPGKEHLLFLVPSRFAPRKTYEVEIESIHNKLARAADTGHSKSHICARAARPSGCAGCGAGAGCSAIRYQSLNLLFLDAKLVVEAWKVSTMKATQGKSMVSRIKCHAKATRIV